MPNQENLTLKVGEVHLVTLQSRGAVGLQLAGRTDDAAIIEVERQEYAPGDTPKPMPATLGGPIPAVFAIKALRAGEATVTFAESRVWDKNFKAIIQKKIRVVVTGDNLHL